MTTLKKDLGKAGAYLGDQSGPNDSLPDVLRAICAGPVGSLSAYQATVATATLASMVAPSSGRLNNLRTAVATCGSAGATTVQVQVNGTSKGELTTDNADADGIKKSVAIDQAIVAGDLIQIVVTAAPTGGVGLTATTTLQPVTIEA